MLTDAQISALAERWLRPDAELDRELDAVLGLTARREREARWVEILNRRFVRPAFPFFRP